MLKILVPTDFSENSKAGIRFALQLASQTSVELEFYHLIEIIKPTSWTEKRFKFMAQQRLKRSVAKLKTFVATILHKSNHKPGNFHYTAVVGTHAGEHISAHAKKMKADYICLSTHGAGKLRKLFGTHASALVTSSTVPVIVVPKGYRTKPIGNLFYASDFINLSKEIEKVEELASLLKAKVQVWHFDYLLHVNENRKKLEKKAAKYRSNSISFHLKRQEVEFTLSEHFRKYIKKVKPQLVILFTKPNHDWYDRLFLNINSTEMAFNSKVPLLVFRKRSR